MLVPEWSVNRDRVKATRRDAGFCVGCGQRPHQHGELCAPCRARVHARLKASRQRRDAMMKRHRDRVAERAMRVLREVHINGVTFVVVND